MPGSVEHVKKLEQSDRRYRPVPYWGIPLYAAKAGFLEEEQVAQYQGMLQMLTINR